MQRMRKVGVLVAVVILASFLGAELVGGLLRPSLAPPEALARVPADRDTAALADLRRRFPRDPRVLLLSAYAADDRADAERYLREALEERRTLRNHFPDGKLEATLRSILARLLLAKGEDAEAREVLRPSCGPQLLGIAAGAGLDGDWVESACGVETGS
jgi:hypothetical protein